jgi:hypothetical protein
LGRDSYEVIRQVLVFEGLGRVEIEALPPQQLREASARAAAAATGLPATDRDSLQQAELRARLVLRDAELDTTGDLRLASTLGTVRVEGLVRSTVLRHRVVTELAAIPHLEVALFAPIGERSGANVKGRSPAAAAWIDRANEESLLSGTPVPELQRRAARIRQRTAALQELAIRYSTVEAEELTPTARGLLERLVSAHYSALGQEMVGLQPHIDDMLGSSAIHVTLSGTAPLDWTRHTSRAVRCAEGLERSLDNVLRPSSSGRIGETSVGRRRLVNSIAELATALSR